MCVDPPVFGGPLALPHNRHTPSHLITATPRGRTCAARTTAVRDLDAVRRGRAPFSALLLDAFQALLRVPARLAAPRAIADGGRVKLRGVQNSWRTVDGARVRLYGGRMIFMGARLHTPRRLLYTRRRDIAITHRSAHRHVGIIYVPSTAPRRRWGRMSFHVGGRRVAGGGAGSIPGRTRCGCLMESGALRKLNLYQESIPCLYSLYQVYQSEQILELRIIFQLLY